MGPCYPLNQEDQRSYPPGFDGAVFVWDIDKTYLSTQFSSLKGMSRIPFEFAIDKQAIAGMPEVLRGLRRGPGPDYAAAPLYFVSASPPQIRGIVERKMLLDGVEYDGITFKDWAKTLFQLRPGRLREQVGFKLCALLATRQNRPQSREYLFGDNAETDAEAFCLYARLLSPTLSASAADAEMAAAGVKPDDRRCVLDLLSNLGPARGRVEKIFIHQVRASAPERFAKLQPAVSPVQGGYQLALACFELGLLDAQAVAQARASHQSTDLPPAADQEQNALVRKLIRKETLAQLSADASASASTFSK